MIQTSLYSGHHYRNKRHRMHGFILADVLVAFSLASIFAIYSVELGMGPSYIFRSAQQRNWLIDIYQDHVSEFENMNPHESRIRTITDSRFSMPIVIEGQARWYGNDRIQTDIQISSGSIRSGPVVFSSVRSKYYDSMMGIGSSVCSPDILRNGHFGSYGFDLEQHSDLPIRVESIRLPIEETIPLTDLQVRNGIAYISADSSHLSDSDLMVFDITNHDNINMLSSIDTGPGISAITIAGKDIFAAVTSTVSQLHVIYLDNLDSLTIKSKYSLPLPYATSTAPYATSIFYDKDTVYLGTRKWNGDELSIIDVSEPSHPIKVGGLETGHQINTMSKINDLLYVAGAGEKQLFSVNISNLSNLQISDSFDPSGWERQEGNRLSTFEGDIFLGRTSGGFNIGRDHEIFSWREGLNRLNDYYGSIDSPGGIYGIITDRSHVYVASNEADKEFMIIDRDLSSDTVRAIPLPAAPRSMTCDNDRIYILARTAPVIYVIYADRNRP